MQVRLGQAMASAPMLLCKLLRDYCGSLLLPAPCSLLPAPCSLLPAPCSLLPAPAPTPYSCWQGVSRKVQKELLHACMHPAGERAALFLGPVPEDKLPKDATPGRTLAGMLSLAKQDGGKEDAPGKLALSYR